MEQLKFITDSDEIVRSYFTEVAQKSGIIHLDMNDFQKFADGHSCIAEVIVDSPAPLDSQLKAALGEVKRQGISGIAGVIIAVRYRSSSPMLMKELGDMNDALEEFPGINIARGVQESEEIANDRSIILFVFV